MKTAQEIVDIFANIPDSGCLSKQDAIDACKSFALELVNELDKTKQSEEYFWQSSGGDMHIDINRIKEDLIK